nr:Cell wall protein [Ipomoea batatas]GME15015.1 Cell wall protein [Ipomoea batatas]
MKLVWSPEKASKAYIDTVKSCELFEESSVAELISAMAAGWDAQLIVETWSKGSGTATSVGLAVAGHHAGGRHVCVVPDQESREAYGAAMQSAGVSPEILVGEAEEGSDFRWRSVLDGKSRIVRSVLLPVGKGLDIAHVGAAGGAGRKGESRWIRHFDKESGEEFVIRR